MKEEYYDIWQLQDEVRTCVDGCACCGIWDLNYDRTNQVLRLELDAHLDDDKCDDLRAQLPSAAYYEGEGEHGSQYTIEIR